MASYLQMAAELYSAVSSKQAGDAAAKTDKAVAAFNSAYDITQANQLEADELQNQATAEQSKSTYLARQQASFAAAGVSATTGSPLAVQITTAGRLEQQIQQQYTDVQARRQNFAAQAAMGVYYGDAQAKADSTAGTIALVNGASKAASMIYQGQQSGSIFGSSSDGTTMSGG